jgi:ABC-2 type transport system ATP-binding protein
VKPAGDVVLRTHALTRHFGDLVAVDSLDLELRRGEVLGFLGPNGSGKSTTVAMLLGLITPSAGTIDYGSLARRDIGAIIEGPAFYPYLSGRDNLRALAWATGGVPAERIDSLLRLVGLADSASRKYSTYSLGMRQRLGIASTLLADPAVVILDEPTNGLDPAGQQDVRRLIPSLAGEGRAVLLASHLLHEVQQVCTRVAILRKGRLLATGNVHELLAGVGGWEVRVDDLARAAAVLASVDCVRRVRPVDGHLVAEGEDDPEVGTRIARALAQEGLFVSSLSYSQRSLVDVFLELTAETPGVA